MDAINDRLIELELDNHEHRQYVPYASLEYLFQREIITELLQQCNIKFYQISEVVTAVLNGGLRVFATLVAIRDVDSIAQFMRIDRSSGFSIDSKLPLHADTAVEYIKPLAKRQAFIRNQWKFLVPIISSDQLLRDFDEPTVLPFSTKTPLGKNGAFGKVFAVRVDASSHRLPDLKGEADLVCKELAMPQSSDRSLAEDFEHELHILSSLRFLKHPNIIDLITAFTVGNSHNFLLPRADGDLKDLLNSTQRPPGFQTKREIFSSLWGLSSALQLVHKYFLPAQGVHQVGCHYDIKPGNILYASGNLLLSDFGLSRLRNEDDGSQSLFKRGEGSYMAPECKATDDDFRPGNIGRASDVWSLGCVFAEILVYMSAEPQEGPAMVKKFHDDRKIRLGGVFVCRHFYSDTGVNPAVIRMLDAHIDKVRAGPERRSLVHFAKIIKAVLKFDAAERPKAEDITKYVFHVTQKIDLDEIRFIVENEIGAKEFEVQVEFQRLMIWSKVSGLDTLPLEVPESAWFALEHTYQEYESLQAALKRCLMEIEFIQKELEKKGRPPFRLCYRLQKLLDGIWSMQPPAARQKMHGMLEEQMLEIAHTIVEQKSGISNQTQEATISNKEDIASLVHNVNPRRLICLSTMRGIAAAFEKEDFNGSDLSISRASLQEPSVPVHHHLIYNFSETNSKVLVEKLIYRDLWPSRVDELMQRIDAVATLRSRGIINSVFPILECRGYYHDTSAFEFGFVYDLPTVAKNTIPVTLANAFKLTTSRSSQPSLTLRFALAKSLASHILDFHRGGWLHKGISAHSVICFPKAFPSVAASLESFFFIGFKNSRTNTINAYTVSTTALKDEDKVDEYQHPIYLDNQSVIDQGADPRQRFRQEFDYYSLGMVLIEIARWKPLREITRKVVGDPTKLQKEMLRSEILIVKSYMGDVYGEVIRYCLTTYNGEESTSPSEVRDAFYENVVVPLNRCYV